MLQKVLLSILPFLYLFSLFTVVATAKLTGYEHFLANMTQENGLFETLSVIWLFAITFYGILSLSKYKSLFPKYILILITFLSFLTFLAAMEEISWGQQIFHFQSTDYFAQHNMQKETNLHNLMDANLFSSLIYVSIYILFVFIPLLYKTLLKTLSYLRYFDINMYYILVILFSSTFQIYFYNDFGVQVDKIAHLLSLAFFAYVMYVNGSSILLKIHYTFIVITTFVFMSNYKVFDFFNIQYEIREMFVTLAVLLIFIEFVEKESEIKR